MQSSCTEVSMLTVQAASDDSDDSELDREADAELDDEDDDASIPSISSGEGGDSSAEDELMTSSSDDSDGEEPGAQPGALSLCCTVTNACRLSLHAQHSLAMHCS